MKGDPEFPHADEVKVQPIDMPHHREALRRALLASPHWSKRQSQRFPFWEGDANPMFKRLATVGITLCVLAVVLVSALLLTSTTHIASAKEIAQKSYQAVSALPPEQRGALKQVIKDDPRALLEDANNAKDLQTLTYDQAVSQFPPIAQNPAPALGPSGKDLRSLKFLQFTSANGDIVLLGIGDDNLPILSLRKARGDKPGERKGGPAIVTGGFSSNGTGPVYEYNGKKYTVPAGAVSPDGRIDVRVEGGDVYINGQKATPVQ
jgi:hypothetical protein